MVVTHEQRKKRRRFANDTEDLMVVKDNVNQEKGAPGPDKWLPPNRQFRCEYLERWKLFTDKYGLEFTKKESIPLNRPSMKCRTD